MYYLTDIKPLEDAGKTDVEIVNILSGKTQSPIKIGDLENFFTFEDLASKNPITANWEGVLIDEINLNENGLSAGLIELFKHINKNRSEVVDTTVSEWAEKSWLLTGGLVAAGIITAEQRDSFYALGRGNRFRGLTEALIADVRSQYNNEELPRLNAIDQINTKAGAAQEAAQIAFSQQKTPDQIVADAQTAWNNS
jgi:hypothetical protein